MTYYNDTDTCEICEKDFHGKAFKQYNENNVWTRKWICGTCYRNISRYGTTDLNNIVRLQKEYRKIKSKNRQYNLTNTCDKCGITKLTPKNSFRKYNEKGEWIGKWICRKCYLKNDYKERFINNRRIGNLNPNSNQEKGDKFQNLACKWKKLTDLNKYNDNYNFPIDCIDIETGLKYQIKGKLDSGYDTYSFGHLNKDINKDFDYYIFFCINKDGKIVDKIYIIPKNEFNYRTGITISSKNGWYEQYRITDEETIKKVNDIWKEIIGDK